MSNQYKNALDHAYETLKKEVDECGISVDSAERMIVWGDTVIPIKPGTTQKECLKILRRLVKAEKIQRQNVNQETLL